MFGIMCASRCNGLILCLATVVAAPAVAGAQTIQWRTDYNAARREATETNRPILLDFGTENCFWCKKLDAITFRDPSVVATLNERFVPLKVDAEREPTLTQALRITSYPTCILAGPDGKILGTIEGFVEAPRMVDHLQKVLVNAHTPDWMARDFQEASKAINAGDYARAVSLLKGVAEDGKDRPVQAKARQVLKDVEHQAAVRVARAKALQDKGQNLEAADALTEVLRTYSGTQAAADASTMLTALAAAPELREVQRARRANHLLAEAKEALRTERYLSCLETCEVLTTTYGDLSEAAEASQLAAQIKDNPDRMDRVVTDLSNRLGAMYVALAESHLRKGDKEEAVKCLEQAKQAGPGANEAVLAKLAKLKGQEAQPTRFVKPQR